MPRRIRLISKAHLLQSAHYNDTQNAKFPYDPSRSVWTDKLNEKEITNETKVVFEC